MASPFKVFRKNQKLWVAGLTILAMFGFVFLPTILQIMGGGSGTNPVAFESTYGNLRERELQMLRERHQRTMGILVDLSQTATGYSPLRIQREFEFMFGGSTDDEVATGWLLARHAEEMGMVVSKIMINDFLREITRNAVNVADFHAAFARAGVSDRLFFDMMRDELLAWKLKQLFYPSVVAATPGQRWDYFCRVKRQATIEAAPVAVADYIGQIEDPTDKELKDFFEENKDKLPFPHSPEPSFKKPQKVALEYFKAEIENFATPEMISDEEVLRRYEKDKERYDRLFPEPSAETPAVDTKEKPTEDEQKSADKKQEVKTTENSKQTEAPLKKESGDNNQPQPTPKTEPILPKTERKEQNKEKTPESASDDDRTPPVVLAAFGEQPEAGEKADPEPAAAKPEPPADEQKPADIATPAQKDAKPSETGPSERVKKTIRREIALEKINRIFERLSVTLDEYREKRSAYDYSPTSGKDQGDKAAGPPPRPDFKKLAQEEKLTRKNDLSPDRTGLVAEWDARKSEIGAAQQVDFVTDAQGQLRMRWGPSVRQYAFQAMAKFRPTKAIDDNGNLYLLWKTKDAKEEVPRFDDPGVRDEVLRQWKMIRARELAKKGAEALAVQARDADEPLKQFFAGRPKLEILTPPPFTWMTLDEVALSYAQNSYISDVKGGVDFAGGEFMRTVFRLKPGEVGLAMNNPQTVAYVIRLIEFSPPYEAIWEQFQVDGFRKYEAVAREDRNQIVRSWLIEIKANARFEWTPEHIEIIKKAASEREKEKGVSP